MDFFYFLKINFLHLLSIGYISVLVVSVITYIGTTYLRPTPFTGLSRYHYKLNSEESDFKFAEVKDLGIKEGRARNTFRYKYVMNLNKPWIKKSDIEQPYDVTLDSAYDVIDRKQDWDLSGKELSINFSMEIAGPPSEKELKNILEHFSIEMRDVPFRPGSCYYAITAWITRFDKVN